MRKTLLITTALVAIVFTTGANATDMTIDSDTTITTLTTADNITVSAGNVMVEDNAGFIANGNFTMSGGSITANSDGNSADTGIFVKGDSSVVDISGGNINLTQSRIYKGNDSATSGDINISGGTTTLNEEAYIEMRSENTGNVNMTGGHLILNSNSGLELNTDDNHNVVSDTIKFIVDGTGKADNLKPVIEVNGNNKISSDIEIKAGNLNIASNATLTTEKVTVESGKIVLENSATLNTNGGLTMTGGTLTANANAGATSATYINGNIKVSEDAALVVNTYADIDVENDVITSHNYLTVNGNVEVGDVDNGGGTLTIARTDDKKPFMAINGDFTTQDGATINMSSGDNAGFATLWASGVATLNGGTFNLSRAEMMVNSANISGGTFNINTGGIFTQDDFDISDGTFSLSGESELSSEKDINISGGTINLANGSEIYAGDGILNITGGEITTSGRNDIFGGTTNLSNATINLSGGTSFAADESLIMTSGTLNINDGLVGVNGTPDNDIYTAGNIALSGGTINVNSSANNSFVGTTTLGATLNIADGATLSTYRKFSGDNIEGSLVLMDKSEITTTDTGIVNLSGKLNSDVSGSGTLVIKNSNALVNGNVDGLNLDVKANVRLVDTFKGSLSNLKTTSVYSGYGLNLGTLTLNTDTFKVADNSTLAFKVSGLNNYGKIVAETVQISDNGTNLNLTLDNGVLKKDQTKTFKILDSANITGSFANLSTNARYTFVDKGNGDFDITGKATAGDVVSEAGGNNNNKHTAEAWDKGMPAKASEVAKSVANALNDLSQTNPQAYVDALTALAPESNGSTASTSVEGANQIFGAVGSRLSGGSVSGSKQGMSSGDNYLENGAMWVQGLVNKAKLDKTDGFDADSNGIALGFEKNITDVTKLGVGYAYSNTDIDSTGKKTDVDTHSAIAYGEYKPNNWYVNGIATYSWGAYDENKNVAGIPVKAKYDVDSIALQAMTGYDFVTNLATVTPEVGLRYVNIKQDAYTDSADQSVASKTDNVWTGVAGVKFAKDYGLNNGMVLKPEARFALTYDMSQADSSSVVSLANGAVYSADATPLKRFGQEVGLGLTAEINDNVELSAGYEGRFRSDYTDHTGLLNAKYKF